MDYRNAHKAHPWHGISLGNSVPEEVRAFIEIVPTDTVKYEVDKESGYLSLDRPQKFSNIVPSLYGFLPRTYCGPKMAELTNKALVRLDVEGDGDPLDICILTEKELRDGQSSAHVLLAFVSGQTWTKHKGIQITFVQVFSNKALTARFKGRLRTQDRIYSFGAFPIDLICKIAKTT